MFFQSMIFSQGNSSQSSINVSVSIVSGLAINTLKNNIDFGSVIQSNSDQYLSESPEFGAKFEVLGETRKRVIINYSSNVVLSNSNWVTSFGGNTSTIEFTSSVQHTRRNQNYVNPRNLRNGRTIRLRNSNGVGKLYIWVGGDIHVLPNQEIGDYEGTFNITVAY